MALRNSDQASRMATEQEMYANIDWAKAQAIKAESPDRLTAVGKGFYYSRNKKTNEKNSLRILQNKVPTL